MRQGAILAVIIIAVISTGCAGTPPVISTPAPAPTPSPTPIETPVSTPTEKPKYFNVGLLRAYTNGEIHMLIYSSEPVLIGSMRWIITASYWEPETFEITEYSQISVDGNTSNSNTAIPSEISEVKIRTWERWREGEKINLSLYDKAGGKIAEAGPAYVKKWY